VSSAFLIGCSPEDQEWKKARSARTVDSFESFVAHFPVDKRVAQAKAIIDTLTFSMAVQTSSIDSIELFCKKHPSSHFIDSATSIISALRWRDIEVLFSAISGKIAKNGKDTLLIAEGFPYAKDKTGDSKIESFK